jgi:hypothetical protein
MDYVREFGEYNMVELRSTCVYAVQLGNFQLFDGNHGIAGKHFQLTSFLLLLNVLLRVFMVQVQLVG